MIGDPAIQLLLWWTAAAAALLFIFLACLAWDDWKRAALMAITARLPVKVLQRPGEPRYVEWYHVATPLNLFRVHIHRFVGDDPDGLHDHPWDWALSFLLCGWYWEDRRGRGMGLCARPRRFGYVMTGDTFHRVRLPEGEREVWSLFIFGPYTKSWGFLRPVKTLVGPYRGPQSIARDGYSYEPRGHNESRFDPWPQTALTGAQLRYRDECEAQLGVGA